MWETDSWTTGEISLPSLFRVLHAAGQDEPLYSLMVNTNYPSYGHEILNGATSLWETWDAVTSHSSLNHFMFGYGDVWLRQLSGLGQEDNSIGWGNITFRPILLSNLTSASASTITPRGLASASWTTEQGFLNYTIVVPFGATGTVSLPFQNITESGTNVSNTSGIVSVERVNSTTILVVGSGTYTFTTS